jgi:hypothetical protein
MLGLIMLVACDGGQAADPTPPPGNTAEVTAATPANGPANTPTTPSDSENSGTFAGIDMASADPCTLLTKEEAEGVMGLLDWNPRASPTNDPTYKMWCEFDWFFQDSTPDRSVGLRLIAPNYWQADYDDLERGDAALISPQEVGLGGMPPISTGNTFSAKVPELCNKTLPCVIAKNGDEWLNLTAILTDRSAIQLELTPRNVDYAKQIARHVFERLPLN